MPRVRLLGLILFITTIFMGLAAAATKTAAIKFKRPDQTGSGVVSPQAGEPLPGEPASASPADGSQLEFVSIPVVWPLCGSALLGLVLWFAPAGISGGSKSPSRKRKRRRKK